MRPLLAALLTVLLLTGCINLGAIEDERAAYQQEFLQCMAVAQQQQSIIQQLAKHYKDLCV